MSPTAEGLALNEEERLLREILLTNGVLRRGGNQELTAGRGGILSVSQESHPVLRELLLSHEAYHGVFYANRGLSQRCKRSVGTVERSGAGILAPHALLPHLRPQ